MRNHEKRVALRLLAAKLNSQADSLSHRGQNAQLNSHQALGFTLREIEALVTFLQQASTDIWEILDSDAQPDEAAELRRQRLAAKAQGACSVMAHALARHRWTVSLTTYNAQAVLELCRLAAHALAVPPDELDEQPTDSAPDSDDTAKRKPTSSTSASARQVAPCRTDSEPAEPSPSGNGR